MDHSGNQSAKSTSVGDRYPTATARGGASGSRVALLVISPRFLTVIGSSLLSLVSAAAAAQQNEEPRPQRVTLAYFGERAVQPGVRVGYEAAAWVRRPSELILAGNISGFAVPGGYGLMALFEGGYRATARFGGFFDLRPGLGYTAAWVGSGPPTVSNYLTLSALGGIGYDFFRLLRAPVSVMVRSGVLYRYALPHGPVPGPLEGASYALDAGIAYQFGTGKPRRIELPVELPGPAEAPANLDDPGSTVPTASPPPAAAVTSAAPLAPATTVTPPPATPPAPAPSR